MRIFYTAPIHIPMVGTEGIKRTPLEAALTIETICRGAFTLAEVIHTIFRNGLGNLKPVYNTTALVLPIRSVLRSFV